MVEHDNHGNALTLRLFQQGYVIVLVSAFEKDKNFNAHCN